jgi:catechol 2,3-dioxygenase-like lactoylglutathione lyase family enzyme
MKPVRITPILNVSDVPASVAWFDALGLPLQFAHGPEGFVSAEALAAGAPAGFAGVGDGEACLFLCEDAQGLRGGALPRFEGDDACGATWLSLWWPEPGQVDAVHAAAVQRGVTVLMAPRDEPWGVRECQLQHPDGHVLRVSAALPCGPV